MAEFAALPADDDDDDDDAAAVSIIAFSFSGAAGGGGARIFTKTTVVRLRGVSHSAWKRSAEKLCCDARKMTSTKRKECHCLRCCANSFVSNLLADKPIIMTKNDTYDTDTIQDVSVK